MTCYAKHTKFQPKNEEWKCPRCGIGNSSNIMGSPSFYIDDGPEGSTDCEFLHEEDQIVCTGCDSFWTGKKLERAMTKTLGLVKCKHCKGTGFVKVEEGVK